jgi:hypothetical protein
MSLFSVLSIYMVFNHREWVAKRFFLPFSSENSSKTRFKGEKDCLDPSPLTPLTVMIKNIPKHIVDKDLLCSKLEELYPGKILEVHLCLDLKEVLEKYEKLEFYAKKLLYFRYIVKILFTYILRNYKRKTGRSQVLSHYFYLTCKVDWNLFNSLLRSKGGCN